MYVSHLLAVSLAPFSEAGARATSVGGAYAGPDLGWMATVVAILLVCILAAAYGVKRVVGGAWRVGAAKRSLRVLDVLPLGGRRQMVVVRCYDRTFALGLGEKEVALLAELDAEIVQHEVKPEIAPRARFDATLRKALDRVGSALEHARGSRSRLPERASAGTGDARLGVAHAVDTAAALTALHAATAATAATATSDTRQPARPAPRRNPARSAAAAVPTSIDFIVDDAPEVVA